MLIPNKNRYGILTQEINHSLTSAVYYILTFDILLVRKSVAVIANVFLVVDYTYLFFLSYNQKKYVVSLLHTFYNVYIR